MPLEIVKDIMLPLAEYAVVDEHATMVDALVALDEAQGKVPEGRHPHRAVLVRNIHGRIIGKLGHSAFLAGLEPRYLELGDFAVLSRAGLSKDFIESMRTDLGVWQQGLDHYVARAKRTKVKDVMHPVEENIEESALIGEAIHKLLLYHNAFPRGDSIW